MKKLIVIIALFISTKGSSQIKYIQYMDSVGQVHTSLTALPQVAISGYFANLLNKPTTISGYGITDATSTSGLIYNILNKTANYTILSTDFNTAFLKQLFVFVDCTSGSVTITLPSALAGYLIAITKTDASANTVTVSGLLGNNTLTSQFQARTMCNNTTNWFNQ